MGAFMIAGEASNDFSVLVPIVVGAAIFVLGSSNLQFESLVSGAVGVTAGMTIAVGEWLPSEFTRGITTIAVGAVMLFLTLGRMRRKRQSTSA
jgi:predicted DNA repair protein MutK